MQVDNNYYKLTDTFATKTPALAKASTQKQKDPSKPLKASKNLGIFAISPAPEAAAAAAAKVANAEAKAHLAHGHMMEAERILKMAEETESLLTLAAEIYDRCIPSSSSAYLTFLSIISFFTLF
jgi:transcription factor MYB, plant